MTYPVSLLDEWAIVDGGNPAADAAGRAGDWVPLNGASRVIVLVKVTQGHATPPALTIEQATNESGAGAKAIANAVSIRSNLDTATTDALTKRTAAVSYTPDAALKNKIIAFDIDTALMDINNGFDCLRVSTGASNAANITDITYLLGGQRYPGAAVRTF